jgi:hypothetical protein
MLLSPLRPHTTMAIENVNTATKKAQPNVMISIPNGPTANVRALV